MPSLPFRVTSTGASSTVGFQPNFYPDYMVRPFTIGIGCVTSSSGTTYSVQHTFDYTGSSVFISSNATWFTNTTISSVAVNTDGNYIAPVTAIRLNVTAGSGTVTMTCIQAG